MAPLQVDFERETRRLKLPPEAREKLSTWTCARAIDLERSHLLHRLSLLDLPWGRAAAAGQQARASSGRSGTFPEVWRLKWQPRVRRPADRGRQWAAASRPPHRRVIQPRPAPRPGLADVWWSCAAGRAARCGPDLMQCCRPRRPSPATCATCCRPCPHGQPAAAMAVSARRIQRSSRGS